MCKSNVPNLDAMHETDLKAFYVAALYSTSKKALELFPDKPAGFTRETKNLGHYACNKATAMSCRISGKIPEAQEYERICERIYDRLPLWARF